MQREVSRMNELQSWWEVPAVAYFCHVFQAAFNLFHFEIEELELALLEQEPTEDNIGLAPCASIEQLIMRLLQGCCPRKNVSTENWEDLLRAQFERNGLESKVFVPNESFASWQLRTKIEVLQSLCELRLDSGEIVDQCVESDAMRVTPVGVDNSNNVYWYFFGLRLYKEDPKMHEDFIKKRAAGYSKSTTKNTSSVKRSNGAPKSTKNNCRKSSRTAEKKASSAEEHSTASSGWQLICQTEEDWETLVARLSKSCFSKDKLLSKRITNDFLPLVENVVVERETLMKKKLVQMIPRRTSARIDKVRQQKEQEHAAAEKAKSEKLAEEQFRREREEEEKRKREIEMRAKRLVEREKAIEERAKRAKLRELRSTFDSDDSASVDSYGVPKKKKKRGTRHHFGYKTDCYSSDTGSLNTGSEGDENRKIDSFSESEDDGNGHKDVCDKNDYRKNLGDDESRNEPNLSKSLCERTKMDTDIKETIPSVKTPTRVVNGMQAFANSFQTIPKNNLFTFSNISHSFTSDNCSKNITSMSSTLKVTSDNQNDSRPVAPARASFKMSSVFPNLSKMANVFHNVSVNVPSSSNAAMSERTNSVSIRSGVANLVSTLPEATNSVSSVITTKPLQIVAKIMTPVQIVPKITSAVPTVQSNSMTMNNVLQIGNGQSSFVTVPATGGIFQQGCVVKVQQGLANVQNLRNFRQIGGINVGGKKNSTTACFTYHKNFSAAGQSQYQSEPVQGSSSPFVANLQQNVYKKLNSRPAVMITSSSAQVVQNNELTMMQNSKSSKYIMSSIDKRTRSDL